MRTIRWGIIGCGDVVEKKSGPAIQNTEYSEIAAVMSRTPAKARDFARRFDVPRVYEDSMDLILDPDIDIVYIATPPYAQAGYGMICAVKGKPAYIEKPMGRSFEESREVLRSFQDARLPLFSAYYRRALPRFLKIKEIVDSGVLGTIHYVDVTYRRAPKESEVCTDPAPWRVDPDLAGEGGLFRDLASHTINFLDFLFGRITDSYGLSVNRGGLYRASDTTSIVMVFQNGVTATGNWCFVARDGEKVDECRIFGSAGDLTFSTFGNQPILLRTPAGEESFAIDNPQYIQQPLIRTIVDQLLGRGKCPSDGRCAERTSLVMDSATG